MKRACRIVGLLMSLVLLIAGCSQGASPVASDPQVEKPAAVATPAPEPVTVKVGNVQSASDAGIYIALEQGYFKEQGIEIEFVPIDTAGKMIAPLGAGQLDVGGGALGAGLFNAINRGINLKIVADKGRNPEGFGYQGVIVSKLKADTLKGPADFKGKKVAMPALGSSTEAAWNRWLEGGGLTTKDVELVAMPFPQMGPALANGAIDAAISIEPLIGSQERGGMGVVLQRQDEFYPDQQVAVVLFSEQFAQNRAVGERFILAYIKALRDYNDAFGKKDQQKRERMIEILMKHTTLKDRAQWDLVIQGVLDPNGRVMTKSIEADQQYFLAMGSQEKPLDLAKAIDMGFVEKALQQLGEYK